MKTKLNKMSHIENETAHGSRILAYTCVSCIIHIFVVGTYNVYIYNIFSFNFLTLFKVHKLI